MFIISKNPDIFDDFYRKQNLLYSCHIAETIIEWVFKFGFFVFVPDKLTLHEVIELRGV